MGIRRGRQIADDDLVGDSSNHCSFTIAFIFGLAGRTYLLRCNLDDYFACHFPGLLDLPRFRDPLDTFAHDLIWADSHRTSLK